VDYNSVGARAYGAAEMISRLLGVENPGVLPVVSPEVTPSLELGNLPDELMILAGRRLFGYSQIVPAVAAEFGYIGVSNPANSGVVAVVFLFCTESTGGLAYNVRSNNTDPTRTLDAGIICRDLRWTGATSCHSILGSEAGSTGANIGRFQPPAATTLQIWPLSYVLGPGTNVILANTTANIAFTAGFFGYERSARPEELALT